MKLIDNLPTLTTIFDIDNLEKFPKRRAKIQFSAYPQGAKYKAIKNANYYHITYLKLVYYVSR